MKTQASSIRTHRSWRALVLLIAGLGLATSAQADLIKGVVTDANGNPLFNVDMNVYDAATGAKLPPSDNTDALGRYTLLVEPGRYDVLCAPKIGTGFAPRIRRAVSVSGELALDFVSPVAAEVRGRVTRAADGSAVYPCDLDFDRTDDGSRQPALGDLTGLLGTFIAYVEGSSYTVTATPADTTLAPGRVFDFVAPPPAGSILSLPLQPASYLAGTIRDSNGQPVSGASLKFDDEVLLRRMPSTKGTSDANGFFRVGVAPGVYRVTVEPRVGSSLAAVRVPGVDLSTHRAQDFTLAVGVVVTGRVTDTQGLPVGQADWDAIREDNGIGAATPGDNTNFDGTYRYVVAPGSYRLRVTPPTSTGLDSVVFRNVALVRDTVIDVDYAALGNAGSGGSPVVRFAPLGNPTHTRASITLVVNRAIGDALVELYDVAGRRVRVLHDGPLAAGARSLEWDGKRRSGAQAHTGVYLVRARLDGHERVTRFVLLP